MQLFVKVLQHKVFTREEKMDVSLFVTNNVNKTVTYFKDKVGVIIVLAHTVTCCIYRITNITTTFDLHTKEKNRPAIHYLEGTGICFQASTSTSGADLGGPTSPGPTLFYLSNFFRALYWPLCQYYFSSYIDLKCLLFVCVTVKILFDNTSTC